MFGNWLEQAGYHEYALLPGLPEQNQNWNWNWNWNCQNWNWRFFHKSKDGAGNCKL